LTPPVRSPRLRVAALLLALTIPATAAGGGDAAQGRKTYDRLCTVCHGVSGAGDGPVGAAIDPLPRDFTSGEFKFDADKDGVIGTDEDLEIVIEKGGGAFGGNPVMVSWLQLSDAEVATLVAYIRTLAADRSARE
jgi:mono/diheme cytochrome c family protein